jgi:2-octaprenyl-6-methoxyphenol hydroxylase
VSPEAADREPWAITADVHFDDLNGNSSAALRAGDAIERFTREGPLALLPVPGNAAAWSLVWCMRHAAARARLALDDAAFLAALAERLGHRMAAPVRVGPRASWPLRASALEHVREHRIVHVGNAAQTLHPVAGQGFNLGVRDCIALVDCLARQHPEGMHGPVPPSGAPHDANAGVRASRTGTPDAVLLAVALHEARRRADRRAIGAITATLPALFATPFAPLASARSLGLLALDTLFPLRRALGHLLMFGVRG